MQKRLLYIVFGCAGLIFLCVIGGLLFFGEPMLAALVFAVGLMGIGAFGIYNWYRHQNLVAEADASVETQPEASDSIADSTEITRFLKSAPNFAPLQAGY